MSSYIQYICETQPQCICDRLCVSDDPFEDDFRPTDACSCERGSGGVCKMCFARMVLIDFETGSAPLS